MTNTYRRLQLENHNVRIVRTAPLAVPKRYAPGSMNEPDRIEIDLANIRVTAASFEKHTSGGDSRGSAWIEADHVKRLDELESSSRAIKGEEEETNVDIKVSVLNAIVRSFVSPLSLRIFRSHFFLFLRI